jgi:hypothetical protein
MFAWLLALVCLFHTDAFPGGGTPPSAKLPIFLTVGASQPAGPVAYMKQELDSILDNAGFQVVWEDPRHPDPTGLPSSIVVLELRGVCGLPQGADRLEPSVSSGASLAETAVSAQGVTPFSWVNCANLTRLIGPELSTQPGAEREYLYGRAMARVVAHEVYHVVMGSRDHGRNGVAKASFTVADLLDEVFPFDPGELAKLRRKASDAGSGARAEEPADSAVGR